MAKKVKKKNYNKKLQLCKDALMFNDARTIYKQVVSIFDFLTDFKFLHLKNLYKKSTIKEEF